MRASNRRVIAWELTIHLRARRSMCLARIGSDHGFPGGFAMAAMLGFLIVPVDFTSPPADERRGSRKAPLKQAWQTISLRVLSRSVRARGLKQDERCLGILSHHPFSAHQLDLSLDCARHQSLDKKPLPRQEHGKHRDQRRGRSRHDEIVLGQALLDEVGQSNRDRIGAPV